MRFAVVAIAINLALVLPAAVPWLVRRLPTLAIFTVLMAIPFGYLWFQEVIARADMAFEEPRLPMPIMPLLVPLLLLLGSSLVRASRLPSTAGNSVFRLGLAAALIGVLILPPWVTNMRQRAGLESAAKDSHFEIGGQVLVLPNIAVLHVGGAVSDRLDSRMDERARVATLRELAAIPDSPLLVQRIDLRSRDLDPFSERKPLFDFCGQLTREWARRVCRREQGGVLTALLPNTWTLVARENLADVNGWTVGGEARADQIAKIALAAGVPEIGCDRGSKFCTAVIALTPELTAVWTVWSDPAGESAQQMAERQGRAITRFVQFGLGPTENFEELQKWKL